MADDFVELMDSGAVGWIGLVLVSIWVVYVLLVTVHESGHAVAALLLTNGRVLLRVGRSPGIVRGRLGRLEISWDLRGPPRQDDGEAYLEVSSDPEPHVRLLIALAGPMANLLLALLLLPLCAAGAPRFAVTAIIVASLGLTAWNLLSRSPGSAGREAVAALRARG